MPGKTTGEWTFIVVAAGLKNNLRNLPRPRTIRYFKITLPKGERINFHDQDFSKN